MAATKRIKRNDERTNLVDSLNAHADRDKGRTGDHVIWRYDGAEFNADINNTGGNHLKLGTNVATFTDSGITFGSLASFTGGGISFGVDVSINDSLNVGPSVSGAGSGQIYVGDSNSHRGFLGGTSGGVQLGSVDNLPLNLQVNNATSVTLSVAGHLTPAAARTQDLGSTSLPWGAFYADKANIGAATGAASGEVAFGDTSGGVGTARSTTTATIIGSKSSIPLNLVTANASRLVIDTAGLVTPAATNTQDLGTTALLWRTLYLGTSLLVGTTATLTPLVLALGGAKSSLQTNGLTLNQGAADNEILVLQSTDVAHGMTTDADTATYFSGAKASAAGGGAFLRGFSSSTTGLFFEGNHTTDDVTAATGTTGHFHFRARTKSGSTAIAPSAGSGAKIFTIASNANTRFIFREDGAAYNHVSTAWVTFDDHDDIAILNTVARELARPGNEIHESFVRFVEGGRDWLEAHDLVVFNADGSSFVNSTRMQELLVGAVRQLGARIERLERPRG